MLVILCFRLIWFFEDNCSIFSSLKVWPFWVPFQIIWRPCCKFVTPLCTISLFFWGIIIFVFCFFTLFRYFGFAIRLKLDPLHGAKHVDVCIRHRADFWQNVILASSNIAHHQITWFIAADRMRTFTWYVFFILSSGQRMFVFWHTQWCWQLEFGKLIGFELCFRVYCCAGNTMFLFSQIDEILIVMEPWAEVLD